MNLKALRDLIRFEAGIKGSDTLVGYIDATINEVLRSKTALRQYQEMLLVDQTVVASGVDIKTFSLPSDLQHFIETSIRFSIGGVITDAYFLYRGAKDDASITGPPSRYYRSGNILTVSPYTLSPPDAIFLNYYKIPSLLVLDADLFPIPSIETTVKLEVAARVSRHSDTDRSKEFYDDANRAWSAAQGIQQ